MDHCGATSRSSQGASYTCLLSNKSNLHPNEQIFNDATLLFSKQTSNLATVIPAIDTIDGVLTDATIDFNYSPAIQATAALGLKTLNRYYAKTDQSNVYRLAMSSDLLFIPAKHYTDYSSPVLHPRRKLAYFKKAKWLEIWIEEAKALAFDTYNETYASRIPYVPPGTAASRSKVCQFLLSHYIHIGILS